MNIEGSDGGAPVTGRYRIEKELARGGMGVVYAAIDLSRKRPVALKRLLASAASSQYATRLFQREYHTLVQLQHPRIIEVHDYGVDSEGAYYTMELLDGKDLRELAPLDYRASCRHLRDVASSLALLHARRLVHRDLSARNVRLTSDGRAKLLDFGALASFGVPGEVVGTPPIVPPEALSGQPLDQRADLFALGALAYWLLTARHAYPAQTLQMLPGIWRQGAPVSPSTIAKEIPRELDQLIMALVSLDAVSRPNSAAEVIERLNVIAGLESEEILDDGHSYLSNPKVVGRDRELERLKRLIERVKDDRSASLVIEGEAGIGKTRLLEEMALDAQISGAVVLRVDAEIARGPYGVARSLSAALLVALPDVALEALAPAAGVLGAVFPEVREKFSDRETSAASVDRNEQRLRIQSALAQWFLSVAAERPLILALDNAQMADEASLAFCAALPRLGPRRAVGVVVTCRTGDEVLASHTLDALREASSVVKIGGLTSSDTIALARALFGDVGNAGRLGKWLADRTDGNPMQCIALATQLIAEGHVRYMDGAWTLPSELSGDQLPSGMAQVLERRIADLSPAARRLALSLSVERGKVSIDQSSALSGDEGDALFSALDELVQKGMLVSVGDEYRFSQAALKKHLGELIPEDLRRELHRRAAEYLLGRPEADAAARIDAGWHLLRAGDESRGADILASEGSRLVLSIEGMALAAPGLEAALEIFEREGRSKWALLNVLEALTSAGWYVDRRYAMKHGQRAVALAMEVTGLALASKLARFLGSRLALTIGTLVAAIRHAVRKRHIDVERFRSFEKVFAPLVGTVGTMVGVAATCMDAKLARRFLDDAHILSAFPRDHVLAVMYDYCRYLTLAIEGRVVEAEPIGRRVLEWFQGPEARRVIGDEGAKALSAGQMTSLAMYTALSGRREALDWAKKLEASELSFYRLMGTQTRFVYHVLRAEIVKASPYREQLELNAIQGGTTWQNSIMIPTMLGLCYLSTGEVARLRQSAEEIERLAEDNSSLSTVARLLRAAYHHCRGRPADALSLLESLQAELGESQDLQGMIVTGVHVRALLAAGRVEEARALSRRVARQAIPEERKCGIIVLDVLLAGALAEAESGDTTGAARLLDELIAEHTSYEVPLVLALLHETRARVARYADDSEGTREHVDLMGRWASPTENAALIARWKRLEEEVIDGIGHRVLETRRGPLAPVTAYASAIRTVLERHQGMARARAALHLLLENCNAPSGYLYLGVPPNLRLAAQFPEDTPPSQGVAEQVMGLAEAIHQEHTELTAGVTGTASAMLADDVRSTSDLRPQLLVVARDGRPKVIGAVALRFDATSGDPVAFDLLEAVARSLEGLGELSLGAPSPSVN